MENIKEYILDLEEKFPVDQWMINGIHIWPYIRVKLFIHFYKEKRVSAPARIVPEGKIQRVLRKLKIPYEFVKDSIVLSAFFSRLKPKKLIFFGSHIHRSKQDGKYFNRFFDSMVDYHSLKNEVYMLEFQKNYPNNFNQQAVIPLQKYLDCFKWIYKIRSRTCTRETDVCLENYRDFFNKLQQNFPQTESLRISEGDIIQWAKKISEFTGFFVWFFKKTKPEKIIMSSYYGFDNVTAAIVAAHQLGIKTIDFQHGPQINMNLAYSFWSKIPPEQYNTMPVEYWNWDEDSKKNIDQWGRMKNISAKVVGQPYLEYWMQKSNMVDKSEEQLILYTLQPTIEGVTLEDFLCDNLVEIMRKSSASWILRLHPRSNYNKRAISALLDTYNIETSKYSFENATETPLPQTLSHSSLHVTNWSGCIIEANMMGVPSICIHPLGLELFSRYIDDYLVFYLNPNEPDFTERFITCLAKTAKIKYNKKTLAIPNPLLV